MISFVFFVLFEICKYKNIDLPKWKIYGTNYSFLIIKKENYQWIIISFPHDFITVSSKC